jgi:hypothetical protein
MFIFGHEISKIPDCKVIWMDVYRATPQISNAKVVDVETLRVMLITMVGRGWKDCFEVYYVLEQIPVN